MAAAKSRKSAEEIPFPDTHQAGTVFGPALSDEFFRIREKLRYLSSEPPQLLHIEGGDAVSRIAMAVWWASLLNCREPDAPCMACSSCTRIAMAVHPDIFFLDGREASIKIDDVRGLRPILGEKPHFSSYRVVILAEAQALGIPAANSLLKILEEPSHDTCFVFTVPQRESLLPTLISRGWVLTLPRRSPVGAIEEKESELFDLLGEFMESGSGWFQSSAFKNIDAAGAQNIVIAVQKALMFRHVGQDEAHPVRVFSSITDEAALDIDELCRVSQDALANQVNPQYVVDALVTGIYGIVHRAAKAAAL